MPTLKTFKKNSVMASPYLIKNDVNNVAMMTYINPERQIKNKIIRHKCRF